MTTRNRVQIEDGVVYGQGGGRDLLCDVFRPEEASGPLPAVLLIHGGGWRTGDRTQLRGYGVLIGREGYVCVAPEYRLIPESPWPAQLDDVREAFRWMEKNAEELGIDPSRIAVEGNSAGAHLALMLAADPMIATKACIAVYPPVVFSQDVPVRGAVPLLALADDGGDTELALAASPLHLASPDFPPTQLIHGSEDELVPVEASFEMYEALRAHGVPVDLHVHADQIHAFDADPAFGRLTSQEMLVFLNRYC